MTNRKQRVAELDEAVDRLLEELGVDVGSEAFDAWLSPSGAAEALAKREKPVLIRVGSELAAAEDGYAAIPDEPTFMLVARGAEILLGALRSDITTATATRVVADVVTEACCDSPKCDEERAVHRVRLELEDREAVLVGEAFEPEAMASVAAALADRLDVELVGATAPNAADATPGPAMSARALARWTLQREGPLFVVRDHASRGPREGATREWVGMAAMAFGGAVAWAAAYSAYRSESYQTLAIASAIGVVLTLASYATYFIARHSSRYGARSEALLYAGRDRFVVAPWHSRDGAVNTRPEGRYGAALRGRELEGIDVVPDRGGFTLRAHSSHGPYDIGTLESEEDARTWRNVVLRLIERVSHHPAMAVAAAVLLLACGPSPGPVRPMPPSPDGAPTAPTTSAASQPQPELQPSASPTTSPEAGGPEIIEDDVAEATKLAKASGKALFVEVWAPWCHTCLSMKNFVLPDPSIAALEKRVVFAAIDSDRPKNEAFMDRYTVMVWPTLYVLDPKSGDVLGLWQGAASASELRRFINDAVDSRDAKHAPDGPLAALIAAKRAHAAAKWKEAGAHYQQAVQRGGPSWSRRGEAIAGLQFSAYRRGRWTTCAKLGRDHVAEMKGAALPADFAWVTLRCAKEVKDATLRKKAVERAIARLAKHTAEPPPDASVDDKSDALSIYAGALRNAGDDKGARAAVKKQIALLEAAAKAAPGPEEAATFDYARMGAYLKVGQGEKAVAMLRKRTEQLPDSYEPAARLAQALKALGRHQEAKAPLAAAVEKSYGPRKLRYLSMQADLARELGDAELEKSSLAALVANYEKLSAKQRKHPPTKHLADEAKKRLARL